MKISDRLDRILLGLVAISAGMVSILTLGGYYPSWEFSFVASRELRRLRKRKQNDSR